MGLVPKSSHGPVADLRPRNVLLYTDALDNVMRAQGGAITVRPNTCSLDIEKVRDHYEAYGHDRTHEKSMFSINVIAPFQVTIRYILAWLDCIQWK